MPLKKTNKKRSELFKRRVRPRQKFPITVALYLESAKATIDARDATLEKIFNGLYDWRLLAVCASRKVFMTSPFWFGICKIKATTWIKYENRRLLGKWSFLFRSQYIRFFGQQKEYELKPVFPKRSKS